MSGAPAAISRLVPRWGRLLLALPLLVGGSARSDTRVLLDRGRVSIHAESTPLAEILSRFGQVTGAEIVFESAQPQQLVSVGIETDSEAEALVRLLEGQGLNYVLRLDPTGRKVEMLVITAKAGVAAASVSPTTPTRTKRPSPPAEPDPEDFVPTVAPDVVEDPDPSAPSGNVPEHTMNPVINPVWSPSQPQPPVPASHPGTVPAPVPSPPSYPGPASYPGSPRE